MRPTIFQFDEYFVDSEQHRLEKNGESIVLPPKVFAVLVLLLENHGQLVSNEQILETVWPDTFVEEGNIRYSIHSLRKLIGNDAIETVPKYGYRFAADVAAFTAEEFDAKNTEAMPAEIHRERAAFLKFAVAVIAILLVAGTAIFIGYSYFVGDSTAARANSETSITVMPFQVIGGEANSNSEFQKGIHSSVISKLGKIYGFSVTDGSGNAGNNAPKGVLTGTGRVEGDSVRVSFTFSFAGSNAPATQHSFVVSESNRIEAESAIGFRIAAIIDARLAAEREAAKIADSPLNAELREKYLTAREIIRRKDFGRFEEAAGLMERITAEHPTWQPGWTTRATVSVMIHGDSGCDQGGFAIEKAMNLGEASAEIYVNKGICAYREYDWPAAEAAFVKAIEIDPNFAAAYISYGTMLDFQRRFAEAERKLKTGLDLSPYTAGYNSAMCLHYYFDEKPDDAAKYCRTAQQIDPNYWEVEKTEFWLAVYRNEWKTVLREDFGTDPAKFEAFPEAKALVAGDITEYWRQVLAKRLAAQRNRTPSNVALAVLYIKSGNKELALDHLEKAVDEPQFEPYRLNADPAAAPLRNEPRFVNAMKKMGLGPSSEVSKY